MILKVFSVFDVKAEAFMQPFFMSTNGQAIRSFSDAANDASRGQFNSHPQDFTLFELGSFDDKNAKFEQLEVPVPLGTAFDFLSKSSLAKA